MKKIFVDTDVILDFLAQREPHAQAASELFALIGNAEIKAYTTTQSFANLFYLLGKVLSRDKVSKTLMKVAQVLTVIPVMPEALERAFVSDFKDLEDAMQYYAALDSKVSAIITRNKKDYKYSQIQVFTAAEFIDALAFKH